MAKRRKKYKYQIKYKSPSTPKWKLYHTYPTKDLRDEAFNSMSITFLAKIFNLQKKDAK